MSLTRLTPTSVRSFKHLLTIYFALTEKQVRKQYVQSAPVYEKRQQVTSKIPNFWPLVFEMAPTEIDHYIQPTDSEIIGNCLTSLDVKRFEVPVGSDKASQGGEPRSLQFRFEFSENDFFTNRVLEKKFWYRRSKDGWSGLVSEPVKINWKKGKDPTHGLMDGATKLWDARKKAGDMNKRDLKEYAALAKLMENWSGDNTSFFTWFAFVCAGPSYVTAEESAEATEKLNELKEKFKKGEKIEEDEDEEPIDLEPPMEVHEAGDDLANLIAEDLWPGAIKYFSKNRIPCHWSATTLTRLQLKPKKPQTCPTLTWRTMMSRTTTMRVLRSTFEAWFSPTARIPPSLPRRSRRNRSG